MDFIFKKLKYIFITAIIFINLSFICYANSNYEQYPKSSIGGNIRIDNFGEISKLLKDLTSMTGYTVNFSFGNNKWDNEEIIYESSKKNMKNTWINELL